MDVLESQINNNDPVFQHNQAHNQALAAELRARLADARYGYYDKNADFGFTAAAMLTA